MLTRDKIIELFGLLNTALREKGEMGEVGIVGGAAMCVAFNVRESTKDVDAIFRPTQLIRALVAKIGNDHRLDNDWLNDAAKGFIEGTFATTEVFNGSNLRVWAPEPRYMLAMKCLSGRWDTLDKTDVKFLIDLLLLKKKEEVFVIIEGFFPKERIPPKTQFFIEEIMEKKRKK